LKKRLSAGNEVNEVKQALAQKDLELEKANAEIANLKAKLTEKPQGTSVKPVSEPVDKKKK
jgi:hypothetical protein